LGLNLARGKTHPRSIEYFFWLGGFVSAAVVLVLLGRVALRLLKNAEQEAEHLNTIRSQERAVAEAVMPDKYRETKITVS
jgi:hypothetical protein